MSELTPEGKSKITLCSTCDKTVRQDYCTNCLYCYSWQCNECGYKCKTCDVPTKKRESNVLHKVVLDSRLSFIADLNDSYEELKAFVKKYYPLAWKEFKKGRNQD